MSSTHTNRNAGPNGTERPVVLIVEDEPDVAKTYELWLDDRYDIRLAGGGEEALRMLDDAVDVVLLDRMMPGMSGDEVLERIREREPDPKVAMVTAVDPDFDIIEMGFDDYVTKPPDRDELCDLVEDLLARSEHAEDIQRYRALIAKREALREELSQEALESNEEYAELEARIEALDAELEATGERLLDDAEFVSMLRDLTEPEERERNP